MDIATQIFSTARSTGHIVAKAKSISLQHLLSVDIATPIFSIARLAGHIIVVKAKSIIPLSVDIPTDI